MSVINYALRGVPVLCPDGPARIWYATMISSSSTKAKSYGVILDKDRLVYNYRVAEYPASQVKAIVN